MRKRDTSQHPIATGRRFELGTPSPFQQGIGPLPITVDIYTPSPISVLADIIIATCIVVEQIESQQTRHSDDQQSPES